MDNQRVVTDFKKRPEGKAILDEIIRRYHKGLLNVIKVIGLSGTGKSWLCLRIAELTSMRIHNNNGITVDDVVDNLLDLLKIIRATNKPGRVIVIEEAEVLFPSRRAMSGDNVDATKIFDTMRKKRMVVFMNHPLNKSVDSRIDSMCNLQIETLKIYKGEGVCICKPLRLQTNPASNKVYFHRITDGGREVHRSYFGKPTEELSKQYENKKDDFLDNLYMLLEKKQQIKVDKGLKEAGLGPRKKIIKPLNERELKVYEMRVNQKLMLKDIANQMGISIPRAFGLIKQAENKLRLDLKPPIPLTN